MKILIAHNEYGKRSGEEAVVDRTAALFTALGHEVCRLTRSSASARESLAGKFRAFGAGLHCPSGIRAMRDALERERPDLVNVHNLYPFISPAALQECRKRKIPVVMTVHNFRLICPTGLFMRNGAPCEICLERGNEWGCLSHNCEGSLPKSAAYAARNAIARLKRHYMDCVDTFACITAFQMRKLQQAGFPVEKLTLIPNCIDAPAEGATPPPPKGAGYVAFVGRLSHEKGIDLIIEAGRRNPDIPFRLAGAVGKPELVKDLPANVSLTGFISGKELENFYRDARFVVMASRCYEGFPLAILEAARHGRATIGPDHGGFTEILGDLHPSATSATPANANCNLSEPASADGNHTDPSSSCNNHSPQDSPLLFTPGCAEALNVRIRNLWDNPQLCTELGTLAADKLRREYSADAVSNSWRTLLSKFDNRK